MGWTETDLGTTPTTYNTKALTQLFASYAFYSDEKLEVHAAASRPTNGSFHTNGKGYILWLHCSYLPKDHKKTTCVLTVLLSIDPKNNLIAWKDFGLDSHPENIPPKTFLKKLPNDLGDNWSNNQLEEIKKYYRQQDALKQLLTPGTKISLGSTVRLSSGQNIDWFELRHYHTRHKKLTGVFIPGTYQRVNLGRGWRTRVKQYIPAGHTQPVTL